MSSDLLADLSLNTNLAAPVLLAIAAAALILGAGPGERMREARLLAGAMLAGLAGPLLLEVPERSAWRFEAMLLPFIWAKWSLLLLGIAWGVRSGLRAEPAHRRLAGALLATVCVLLGVVAAAIPSRVRSANAEDGRFWEAVISGELAVSDDETYRRHLSSYGRDRVRGSLAERRPELSPAVLRDLRRLGFDVAGHPNLDPKTMEELFSEGGHEVDLARNPAAPAWLLERLAESGSDDVLVGLAVNPATPLDLARRLAATARATLAEAGDASDAFGASRLHAARTLLTALERHRPESLTGESRPNARP